MLSATSLLSCSGAGLVDGISVVCLASLLTLGEGEVKLVVEPFIMLRPPGAPSGCSQNCVLKINRKTFGWMQHEAGFEGPSADLPPPPILSSQSPAVDSPDLGPVTSSQPDTISGSPGGPQKPASCSSHKMHLLKKHTKTCNAVLHCSQ